MFPYLKSVLLVKNLCMQIMQFTQCVDIVGEVKYNQLPVNFAVGITVSKG